MCLGCGARTYQVSPPTPLPGDAAPAVTSVRDDSITVALLEQRMETAASRRDAAFLDSIWAPTFRFTHSSGSVQTRDELLKAFSAQLPTNGARTLGRDVDSLSVEMHRNTAVTSGLIRVRRCTGATYRAYTVRFVRVYGRLESGRWQLLTHRTIGEIQSESASAAGAPSNNPCN